VLFHTWWRARSLVARAVSCVVSVLCRASFARWRIGFIVVTLSALAVRGARPMSRAGMLFHTLRISSRSANSSRLESLMLFKLLI
jgi:hypothetical protein